MIRITSSTALLCLALTASAPGSASAAEYQVDPVHSALLFGVQHIGLGHTWGRFNDFAGTITWDPQDLSSCTVAVTVQVASVDTHDAKRDAHLRNADLFDAGTHPTMTFTGTGFTAIAGKPDHYSVTGTLTIRGVSKDITCTFRKVGEGSHAFTKQPAVGFEGEFAIDPKDFGVGQGEVAAAIGPGRVIVALEAIAQ